MFLVRDWSCHALTRVPSCCGSSHREATYYSTTHNNPSQVPIHCTHSQHASITRTALSSQRRRFYLMFGDVYVLQCTPSSSPSLTCADWTRPHSGGKCRRVIGRTKAVFLQGQENAPQRLPHHTIQNSRSSFYRRR